MYFLLFLCMSFNFQSSLDRDTVAWEDPDIDVSHSASVISIRFDEPILLELPS